MANLRLMRESAYDPDARAWRPSVAWVYDGIRVSVHDVDASYRHVAAVYVERLEAARRAGWADEDLWGYFARQGGDGYQALRTQPETAKAADVDALLVTLRRAA